MALASKLIPKYLQNEVSYLSESGQARWNIYVKGTGLNNSATPVITVNGTSNLSTYGRGVTLVIWDTNMAVQSTTVYDIYASSTDQNNLATALNGLTAASGNKIWALVSFDAINTNSNLDAAMTARKSQLWNTKYVDLRAATGGVRYPYACIGTTRLGIVSEQIWKDGASDPQAIATWSFEDWDTAGNTGYGPVYSSVAEASGNGYPFFSSGDIKSLLNPSNGEYIRVSMDVKVDKAAYDAGVGSAPYIYDGAWTWAASDNIASLEYRHVDLYIQYTTQSTIYVSVYHMPSNISTGLAYCRNVQVQKCGYNPQPSTARSKMGPAVITSRKFVESPQKFSPGDPDTYWNLWSSSKNLLTGQSYGDQLTGSGTSSETVRWFDRSLTTSYQKFIHWKTTTDTSGENMYSASGFVPVDHTKMYYGAVWMYNFNKTAGRNYVGTHTLNSSDSYISTRDQGGTYNAGTNPYFVYPVAGNITQNKWNLVDCWFLPSTFTQAEATDFYNKYWQKTHSKYNNPGNGNASVNEGNCPLVWMDSSVSKVLLRFLDYYNGTAVSKTWWALPMIVEVTPMTISNYEMSSWHLKEV